MLHFVSFHFIADAHIQAHRDRSGGSSAGTLFRRAVSHHGASGSSLKSCFLLFSPRSKPTTRNTHRRRRPAVSGLLSLFSHFGVFVFSQRFYILLFSRFSRGVFKSPHATPPLSLPFVAQRLKAYLVLPNSSFLRRNETELRCLL